MERECCSTRCGCAAKTTDFILRVVKTLHVARYQTTARLLRLSGSQGSRVRKVELKRHVVHRKQQRPAQECDVQGGVIIGDDLTQQVDLVESHTTAQDDIDAVRRPNTIVRHSNVGQEFVQEGEALIDMVRSSGPWHERHL
jgi:hypothetical protein